MLNKILNKIQTTHNNTKIEYIKSQIHKFINNKKGSDDKNAGSAMSIIIAVVIGVLVLGLLYAFFKDQFFPAVISKIMDALNYSG